MPVYGVAQSGPNATSGLNLTSLIPGDLPLTLFNGTETPAIGLRSVAFSRGYSAGASDNGITFKLSGMPTGMTVDVQCAESNVDGDYTSIATLSPSTSPDTGNAAYTDVGRSTFYRLYVSAYTSGTMPTAVAQR
jgi:hypothetical protein